MKKFYCFQPDAIPKRYGLLRQNNETGRFCLADSKGAKYQKLPKKLSPFFAHFFDKEKAQLKEILKNTDFWKPKYHVW